MYKLELRGHLLYLNGNRQTLSKAEAHNARKIPIELQPNGRIDSSKSHCNKVIVPIEYESLEGKVKKIISDAGINIESGRYSRSNKGLAIEWLFTVTPGFECAYIDLYKKALEWLQKLLPNCPIVYAIIHFDEADPHMHVVMVPLQGERLPASKILGFKGVSRARIIDLYEQVGKKFGLSHPVRLTGAAKKRAAELTIKVCERFDYCKILGRMWQPLVMAINSRPEPFMDALGISNIQDESPTK
jgi:hypothetical protein